MAFKHDVFDLLVAAGLIKIVSCADMVAECQDHCYHAIPHDPVAMCREGLCCITFKHCHCTDKIPFKTGKISKYIFPF